MSKHSRKVESSEKTRSSRGHACIQENSLMNKRSIKYKTEQERLQKH